MGGDGAVPICLARSVRARRSHRGLNRQIGLSSSITATRQEDLTVAGIYRLTASAHDAIGAQVRQGVSLGDDATVVLGVMNCYFVLENVKNGKADR